MAASILKNITWLGVGNAVVKPLWFIFITAVCVQILGVDEYGVMTASLALAGIVGSLINVGTSQFSIREVARDRDRAALFFSNFFPFRAAMSLLGLGLVLLVGLALGHRSGDLLALALAACYGFMLNLTEYCRAFYRAFELLRYEAVSIILEKIVVISAGTVLLVVQPRAAWVLGGMALGMMLTLLGNVRWLTYRLTAFRRDLIDRAFFRRALPQALPLGLASIFVMLYFRTDSVMLEAIQGASVTGQYGLAFRILEALILLPAIIVAVLLPRLSNLFGTEQQEAFRGLMRRGVGIMAAISLVIALGLTLTAPVVITLLEPDPSAAPAVGALRLLAWTFPFASVNYLLSTALTATDDQKALAWMLGAAAVFNIGLNGVLIPLYSLYGACIATLLTQAGITVAMGLRYAHGRSNSDATP